MAKLVLHEPYPPEAISRARRALGDLEPEIAVSNWAWDQAIKKWCLGFKVIVDSPQCLPKETSWTAVVEDSYPEGIISIYPSCDGGIVNTYPHQSDNGQDLLGSFCKSGKLCLFTDEGDYARGGDADYSLYAYIERTIGWVNAANEDALFKKDDHLEYPMYSYHCSMTALYLEDEGSFKKWNDNETACDGIVEVSTISQSVIVLRHFLTKDSLSVHLPRWGKTVENSKPINSSEGIWVRVKSVPHVKIWQAPRTYKELREWMESDGISFDELIAKYSNRMRDGNRHVFAIAVPSADIVGDEDNRLVWFVVFLPPLATRSLFGRPGGTRERTLRAVDKQKNLGGHVCVDWMRTSNCELSQLHSRGSLPREVVDSRVLIIGAGSLGSDIANLFVRGGVTNLTISDGDTFEPGNITRHVLPVLQAGCEKANALADYLNSISPVAKVEFMNSVSNDVASTLLDFDIIIDCSSSSRVLDLLEHSGGEAQLFVCAFGYGAENTYFCSSRLGRFSAKIYWEKFGSLLLNEKKKAERAGLPWEGLGCWSPVFPARASDVSGSAALIVDCISKAVIFDQADQYIAFTTERGDSEFISEIKRVNL